MKSKFLFLILILLYSPNSYSENFDFRKSHWGMSQDQVISVEEIPAEKDNEFLYYQGKLLNMDTTIIYQFINNQLHSGYYMMDPDSHSNKNDFINDFLKLKDLLIKKYKEPKSDETIWKNDLFKNDSNSYGLAISKGDLVYKTIWESETTKVLLILSGNNYKINFSLYYSTKDPKLSKLVDDKELSEAMGDL